MSSIIFYVEVNITEGRRTRLRADMIQEIREDFVGVKGQPKEAVLRIIMMGGASHTVHGESIESLWDRIQGALQAPMHTIKAPLLEA